MPLFGEGGEKIHHGLLPVAGLLHQCCVRGRAPGESLRLSMEWLWQFPGKTSSVFKYEDQFSHVDRINSV